MKKILVLTLSAVLVLSFLVVSPAAATTYWTGDPDPMACNVYHDCHWVTPVCIEGNTYSIGIYHEPAGVTAEQIEANALHWTETVLTAGACEVAFHGYSVPHVLLYTSAELINGYGILVSTQPLASVENIMGAFKLTAIPADLKELCEGPVTQMNPNDTQGKWACDYLLVDILPYGRPGGRLPLINTDGNSLQKVYEKILSWIN